MNTQSFCHLPIIKFVLLPGLYIHSSLDNVESRVHREFDGSLKF